jgi:hypothetical protein
MDEFFSIFKIIIESTLEVKFPNEFEAPCKEPGCLQCLGAVPSHDFVRSYGVEKLPSEIVTDQENREIWRGSLNQKKNL